MHIESVALIHLHLRQALGLEQLTKLGVDECLPFAGHLSVVAGIRGTVKIVQDGEQLLQHIHGRIADRVATLTHGALAEIVKLGVGGGTCPANPSLLPLWPPLGLLPKLLRSLRGIDLLLLGGFS